MTDLLPKAQRYYVCHAEAGEPRFLPGVTYALAANGLFKVGKNRDMTIVVPMHIQMMDLPDLLTLLPSVQFAGYDLPMLRVHLQTMYYYSIDHKEEVQFFVVNEGSYCRTIKPRQTGTEGHLDYIQPEQPILIDVHTHGTQPAFFSRTDDQDDLGLSVSCVIGSIGSTAPVIACRLNCYGAHWPIPALSIWDDIAPLTDVFPAVGSLPHLRMQSEANSGLRLPRIPPKGGPKSFRERLQDAFHRRRSADV